VAFASILLFAGKGSAQVHRVFIHQVDNGGQGDLAGTVTNDIFIAFAGELRGQYLLLDLSQGAIFQHPLGTDTPPSPLLFPAHSSLAYDSFVAMGGADSDSSNALVIVRDFDDPVPFGSDYVMVKWAPATGVVITDETSFLTARLSLSDNAQGTWQYFGSISGGDQGTMFSGGMIRGGVMTIPEPSTAFLAVVVISAIALAFLRQMTVPLYQQLK
jgi:hypothetical protein